MSSGCSTLAYYYQAASGHLDLLARAQSIDNFLSNPNTDPGLKFKLSQVKQVRDFASIELSLPLNESYTRYADLERPYVVWNVYAAPALSTELIQWCFLVAGCVEYRGYFDKNAAEALANELRLESFDVLVDGVRAYSTLGWFADPVLNTFIKSSTTEIARLIFHELAHQEIYVADDTVFNESFATAVELEGLNRWLTKFGTPEMRSKFIESQRRHQEFATLVLEFRGMLQALYQSDVTLEEKHASKVKILSELTARYAALRASYQGAPGRDRWGGEQLNNAHLGSIALYSEHVPAFTAMIKKHDGDLPSFFKEVKLLSQQPKIHRDKILAELGGK